jgi:hypothetical protein
MHAVRTGPCLWNSERYAAGKSTPTGLLAGYPQQ